MALPTFGAPIVRAATSGLEDVVVAGLTGGDILVYDGVDTWRNRVMTGDVAITAAGLTAIQAGVITDADISPTAEIQVSKLLDGAARQLLQTDAAGTGVEWTDDIDVPGTLDVSGLGTFDAGIIIVVGSLDLNNQGGLLNIGAAGNDFGAIQLDLVANYSIVGAGALDIGVAAGFDIQLGDDVVLLTIKGDGTVDINAATLDLLGVAVIANIGAADNNFGAAQMDLVAGYTIEGAGDLIIRVSSAGIARSMIHDITVGAGGAANAVLFHSFRLDSSTGANEAGLYGETDGSGSVTATTQIWKIPYRDSGANVAAPANPNAFQDGGMRIEAGDDAERIYVISNGAWKYVAVSAGFEWPAAERVTYGHRWEVDDIAIMRVDKIVGSDEAVHALPYSAHEWLQSTLPVIPVYHDLTVQVAEIEGHIAELQRELVELKRG